METNELNVIEETVTENTVVVAEEAAEKKKLGAGEVVVGIGLIALAGGALYKWVVKPIVKHVKAKKAKKQQATPEEITPDVKDVFDEEKFGDGEDKSAE